MVRRGMHTDVRERLARAFEEGCCITSCSKNDARRLNKAVERGDLVSPAQGVYLLPEMWSREKPTQRDLAVARTLQEGDPNLAFCGVTAAIAYGLAVSFSLTGNTHAAVSRRAHTRARGMRGVERHVVEGDDMVRVSGIWVTSIERTVFDCLRTLGFRDGLAIVDSALHKGLATQEQLRNAFTAYANRFEGRRRAIDTLALANSLAESGGESVARAVMIERGFKLPELQRNVADVVDGRHGYRVDFYWELEDVRDVIGELDGREKYVNPQMTGGRDVLDVLADERLRESRVSGGDARVMRFSYAQVLDRAYFTRLLCTYGVPRDADIPWVALREDDAEAKLERHERLFLGRWLPYAVCHGLPMPQVA